MGVGHLHVGTAGSPVDHMTGDWRDLAACIGQPELFYDDTHLYEATQICGTCPVISHCRTARRTLEITRKQAHPGVWAGEYYAIRNHTRFPTRARRIA